MNKLWENMILMDMFQLDILIVDGVKEQYFDGQIFLWTKDIVDVKIMVETTCKILNISFV